MCLAGFFHVAVTRIPVSPQCTRPEMPHATTPELYWISGSPPSWRVMLGLTLKDVAFTSHRLDHGAGEHRTPAYLALNPKGQVPVLRHGPVVMRESIAILAYLDRVWPARPLFGATPAESAAIWQQVMEFEADLRPAVTTLAQGYLRGVAAEGAVALASATDGFLSALDTFSARLRATSFLCSAKPTAADCWLYPALGWIDRALVKATDPVPSHLATYLADRPALDDWRTRFAALPSVAGTTPPHWID